MRKINLLEIARAWINSFTVSDEETLRVIEKRLKTCDMCEYKSYRKIRKIYVCNACGCPIKKKIFSPKGKDACPMKYWNE